MGLERWLSRCPCTSWLEFNSQDSHGIEGENQFPLIYTNYIKSDEVKHLNGLVCSCLRNRLQMRSPSSASGNMKKVEWSKGMEAELRLLLPQGRSWGAGSVPHFGLPLLAGQMILFLSSAEVVWLPTSEIEQASQRFLGHALYHAPGHAPRSLREFPNASRVWKLGKDVCEFVKTCRPQVGAGDKLNVRACFLEDFCFVFIETT